MLEFGEGREFVNDVFGGGYYLGKVVGVLRYNFGGFDNDIIVGDVCDFGDVFCLKEVFDGKGVFIVFMLVLK